MTDWLTDSLAYPLKSKVCRVILHEITTDITNIGIYPITIVVASIVNFTIMFQNTFLE